MSVNPSSSHAEDLELMDSKDRDSAKSPSHPGATLRSIISEADPKVVHERVTREIPPDVRAEWLRAYEQFDINKEHELNATQVYAALTINTPPELQVDWSVLSEIFDECDTGRKKTCDVAMFERIMHQVYNGGVDRRAPQDAFLTVMLALLFYPLFAPFAWPTCHGEGGSYVRFLLSKLLTYSNFPLGVRNRILTSIPLFLIFYLITTAMYVLAIGNFVIGMIFLITNDPIRVSVMEPVIALCAYLFLVITFARIFTLTDKKSFDAIRKALDGGRMDHVKVIANAEFKAVFQNAEDVVSALLYMEPANAKSDRFWQRFNFITSLCAGFVMGAIPFLVRIYYGYDFLGTCGAVTGDDSCTGNNDAYRVISVVSFVMTLAAVSYLFNLLMFTGFHFAERESWYKRFNKLTDEKDSKKAKLPFLSMEHTENIIAWYKLRSYITNIKSTDMARTEIILESFVVMVVALIGLIVYQRIEGFAQLINSGVIYVDTGFFVGIIGGYVVYPTLFRGVRINDALGKLTGFWSDEKWRLRAKAFSGVPEEEQKTLEGCADLAEQLDTFVTEHAVTFSLLGVTVNRALVYSVASSAFASLWAWVSPYLE